MKLLALLFRGESGIICTVAVSEFQMTRALADRLCTDLLVSQLNANTHRTPRKQSVPNTRSIDITFQGVGLSCGIGLEFKQQHARTSISRNLPVTLHPFGIFCVLAQHSP